VNATPTLKVDGVYTPDPWTSSAIRSSINSRLAVARPCTIDVTAQMAGRVIDVTVRVTAEQDMHDASQRLFVALISKCHEHVNTYYWYPFWDMKPTATGQSFQLDADSSYEYSTSFDTYYEWSVLDLRVIAFVQKYSSREILQAGFADLREPLTLVINEIMADNTMTIQDPQGEYEDWVEIYNLGPDAVNLGGLHLTDTFSDPDKWTFPDTLLPAGQYLIVWCDYDVGDPGLHANFELATSGEKVGLYRDLVVCHALVDRITFPAIDTDVSYGRLCDGWAEWEFFDDPTPEAANSGCVDTVRNLTIFPDGGDIRLFWQSVAWAGSYTVYRHSSVPFEPGQPDSIGTTTDTTYLDAGVLLTDPTAFYRVTASP
jgi:hypothetical protein